MRPSQHYIRIHLLGRETGPLAKSYGPQQPPTGPVLTHQVERGDQGWEHLDDGSMVSTIVQLSQDQLQALVPQQQQFALILLSNKQTTSLNKIKLLLI